jgi:hypothetical protein
MSVFIRDKNTFRLDFWIKHLGDYNFRFVNKQTWEKMTDEERVEFQHCWVSFKPLNWRMHNELRDRAIYDNLETGQKDWSQPTYAQEKLKAVIIDWSFTEEDEDGNELKVPVSDQSLSSLHPGIAEIIMDTYEEHTELTDDKKKEL